MLELLKLLDIDDIILRIGNRLHIEKQICAKIFHDAELMKRVACTLFSIFENSCTRSTRALLYITIFNYFALRK